MVIFIDGTAMGTGRVQIPWIRSEGGDIQAGNMGIVFVYKLACNVCFICTGFGMGIVKKKTKSFDSRLEF